jgi:hypothetical protein
LLIVFVLFILLIILIFHINLFIFIFLITFTFIFFKLWDCLLHIWFGRLKLLWRNIIWLFYSLILFFNSIYIYRLRNDIIVFIWLVFLIHLFFRLQNIYFCHIMFLNTALIIINRKGNILKIIVLYRIIWF